MWSEAALRVIADTDTTLVTACCPGAEALWPSPYDRARSVGEPSVRTEAFEAMAAGEWELASAVWQETVQMLWKPPAAWFSVNAFYVPDGDGYRLRNWYVNFEHPTRRMTSGFDTFDLAVDLVIDSNLSALRWKDEDEYAHVRRLGVVSDTEHQAVELARTQVLAMLEDRAGPFAGTDQWATWRWDASWPPPRFPLHPLAP
ncbi:DUF402 domain-containing protein [Streptomyces sp. NEAU-S77]|uniref:DUF402 domain-containing protein n=1 Tax=Streptomyces sp. NEAU-S77 TaxID=3411033 RepID=UPI003BA29FB7